MTETPPTLTETEIATILQQLRRKEGTWLEWASACQSLQKSGLSPQAIFEATGFEPIQQNQIITALQIYRSIETGQANAPTLNHFQQRASDCLYELRILNQQERVWGAELIVSRGLDADAAHEIAKALKNASRIKIPDTFRETGGDRIAAYYWNLARQQSELAERSRLIARGLSYAQSQSARQELETLLVKGVVAAPQAAPRLPLYRLESEEEMPRIVPVIGQYPVSSQALRQLPQFAQGGVFTILQASEPSQFVAIPGWQVIRQAQDPIALLAQTPDLPNFPVDIPKDQVLVIGDRGQRAWNPESYFVVDHAGEAQMQWSETPLELEILAQVILILRPKQILDETATFNTWLIDE